MKKQYAEIEMALLLLGEEDVIRTSGNEEETLPPIDDENQGEWT